MIDINNLKNKQDNDEQREYAAELPASEKLSANEFVEGIVKPIIELQDTTVRKVVRGSTTYLPVDGVITFPSDAATVGIAAQESTTAFVETGKTVCLHLRITSIEGGTDTGNLVNVEIQRYANGGYTTVKTFSVPSRPMSYTEYDEFDITDCLNDGDNQIRVQATDVETLATGRIIFASVVKASLSVEPMFDWERAITNLSAGIPLSYAVSGTGVNKTLHVRIYDNQQNQYRELTYVIGTATYPLSNPYMPDENPKDADTDSVKILTHGVHTIEAWVSCTSNGVTKSSAHIKNQVMVVADAENDNTYLMVQQTSGIEEGTVGDPYFEADNYVQQERLLAFAVYNPANPISGTGVSLSMDSANGQENCFKYETNAKNATKYYIPATIQLENAVVGTDSYVYLSASDAQGNNILASKDNARLAVAVHNQYNFAPTKGADLYINPSTRNNSEANPGRILNAAKGNVEVASTFTNFRFDGNDGWLQNEDGQRVLRVLAGQKVTIGYDPFAEFAENPAANVTIELDMMVKNVTNEEDPIIKIANEVLASGKFVGVKMNPLEGCIMTASQTTYGQQNFAWREGVKTHIAINICSAVYADPNSRNTLPLVRVFVNANPYREFMFALEEEEWGKNAFNMEIGQSDAEIDIYAMRVYKKAVSAQDIMQNYKSSLTTTDAKLDFERANDILAADGTISYEKAREKYSCIVHHGVPTSLQNPDDTTCWIHIDHMVNGVYDKGTSGDICKATKSLPVKGQGSTAKHYCDWNQQYDAGKAEGKIVVDGVEVTDGWVDGNGTYKGAYYQLDTADAKAEKLVGKINYASSMQSHKMGATNAYNDLYRAVMGDSLDTIMAADSKARCTCKEDRFLFFVQETETSTPQFQGIMTFGSGKMDKKTWGYSSSTYPDFAMFEGSDNDQPVTNFERPFNDDVTYNPDEEYYEYNGKGNIDFDAGATVTNADNKKIPTGTAVNVIRDFINFGYMHCTDLLPWQDNGGTATSLIAAGNTIDIHKQYWITTADSDAARGDLYSWSPLDGAWVRAGLERTVRNVFEENTSVTFSADYEATNNALIQSIITRFKTNSYRYYNVRSKLFHSAFVENLLAGSDNCAKNTYYVADPLKHIICFHADDLDSIFKTDNVSWQTKAYYVDRVHHIDDNGTETYSGTHNMFFNTFDRAYESEKQAMMKDIFTAMASLGGSVNGFMEKYFFSIQRSIPAVAYLEQARIRYEKRQIQVNNNEITLDTVNPITQQLGSQLESELQYMDRRLVYFQSYAAYGTFGVGGGGNNFGFRGYPKRNGQAAKIEFTLKPHQYIYPTAAYGQTLINPHKRLAPGETYNIVLEEACDSDTTCSLFGLDYYKEIGNLGDLSVNPSYEISIGGKRLTKVEAYPTNGGDGEFRPSQLSVKATLVDTVKINVKDVGQNLNLSAQTRLREIDLTGTQLNKVTLPETQTLEKVSLGANMTQITASNLPNLSQLNVAGYALLTDITVVNTPKLNTYNLLKGCYNSGSNGLSKLMLGNMNWTGVSSVMLDYVSNVNNVSLAGSVYMEAGQNISSSLKQQLISKFGNVDSTDNSLYVNYTKRSVSSLDVIGPAIARTTGEYAFSMVINPNTANNFKQVAWSVPENRFCTINASTGVLTVTEVAVESVEQPVIPVTATVTLLDDTTMSASANIKLYNRIPKVGDFAYSDGEFDDELHTGKTVVGWVYKVTQVDDTHYECLVEAADTIKMKTSDGEASFNDSLPWGIYPNNDGNSIPNAVLDAIATSSGFTDRSQVSDIPTISNNGTSGLLNSDGTGYQSYIRDYSAYDDSEDDGFATILAGSAHADWAGKTKTAAIVAHANKILQGYVETMVSSDGKTVYDLTGSDHVKPTNLTELADLLRALGTLGGSTVYRQLAYPAAYSCYLFQPEADDLDNQYRKNNWYLPAEGDKVRQYIFFRNSRGLTPKDSGSASKDYADENNANRPQEPTDARRPWYANLLQRAYAKGVNCPVAMPPQAGAWSSAEGGSSYAWYVGFVDGGTGYNYKCDSYVVRPCVAYTFTL